MKIQRINDKIVVELDFYQHKNNPYDDEEEKQLTHNLVGVIAGDEFTISQINDLSYKDSQQEGPPLIHFYGDRKEFEELCKELGIAIWEHELCAYCKKPIYGAYSLGDKGAECFNCERKEKACTNCGANERGEVSDWCVDCLGNE